MGGELKSIDRLLEPEPKDLPGEDLAMLAYTCYPDDDFTWLVLTGDTTIEAWFQTVQQCGRQGMTRYEL